MASPEQFVAFLVAAVVLNISPGIDHVYILSRTIAQGRFVGFMSSWGVCMGAMVHVVAAAVGVSAVLAASATAFTVVKVVGAGYLIWLGIQALRSKGLAVNVEDLTGDTKAPVTPWASFRQGVLIDVLNPKVAIFFLAFLPQFVDASRGAAWWQIIFLGSIVILIAFIWEAILVVGAGFIAGWLQRQQQATTWLNRTMGTVFIGLGVWLVTQRQS